MLKLPDFGRLYNCISDTYSSVTGQISSLFLFIFFNSMALKMCFSLSFCIVILSETKYLQMITVYIQILHCAQNDKLRSE